MSAFAHHTQTSDQQPSSTSQAKFVDTAKPVKGNGANHLRNAGIREIVGGVSVAVGAPQSVKDSLERGGRIAREEAALREKRNAPAKNPWTDEQKEIAGLWREHRTRQAYEAYWNRDKTGVAPTEAQKKLVGRDLNRESRERNRPPADMMPEPGSEPWITAKAYARDRVKNGYVAAADAKAGGKYPIGAAFSETYLRSTLSPVFRRFVTDTPKAGKARRRPDGTEMQRLMSGPAKDDRKIQWSKLEGLDQSHIALQSVLRGGFRHELDRDFVSMRTLRRFIRRKVREGKLACEPHVVVFSVCPKTGYIQHPHLWFFLPEDQKVLYDLSIKGCRRAPMDLYDGVVNGVFQVLEEIGADAGGLGNPIDGKNPLDPKWSFEVWNEDKFPTLQEWSLCVNVHLRRDHVVREQAIMKSGTCAKISNQVFGDAKRMARPLLRAAHMSADLGYRALLDDRRRLADEWLFDRLMPAFDDMSNIEKVSNVVLIVARYEAADWDPSRLDPKKNRGRGYANVRHIPCRHEDGSVDDEGVLKRNKIGGAVGRAVVKSETIALMVEAMKSLAGAGRPVTHRLVGELVDRHPKTIGRNWKLARSAFDAGTPVDFQYLLRGSSDIGENIKPDPTEPATCNEPYEDYPCAVRGWPGGYQHMDCEPNNTATPQFGSVTTALDPCCPATDALQHAAYIRPSKPIDHSSAPSSPDRAALECHSLAAAGDGPGLQQNLPAQAGGRWSTGPADAGRGDHASGDRGGDVPIVGSRKTDSAIGGRKPEIGGRSEQPTDLQQFRDQATDRARGGRDPCPTRKFTYADRDSLTLAEGRLILFVPVASREGADRSATPPCQ